MAEERWAHLDWFKEVRRARCFILPIPKLIRQFPWMDVSMLCGKRIPGFFRQIQASSKNIPKDTILYGFEYDLSTGSLRFYCHHPSFNLQREGEEVERERVEFLEVNDGWEDVTTWKGSGGEEGNDG